MGLMKLIKSHSHTNTQKYQKQQRHILTTREQRRLPFVSGQPLNKHDCKGWWSVELLVLVCGCYMNAGRGKKCLLWHKGFECDGNGSKIMGHQKYRLNKEKQSCHGNSEVLFDKWCTNIDKTTVVPYSDVVSKVYNFKNDSGQQQILISDDFVSQNVFLAVIWKISWFFLVAHHVWEKLNFFCFLSLTHKSLRNTDFTMHFNVLLLKKNHCCWLTHNYLIQHMIC